MKFSTGTQVTRTVRFQPNIVNQVVPLPIPINNNNIALEDDIIITMAIVGVPSPLITVGTPSSTTVRITDDDSECWEMLTGNLFCEKLYINRNNFSYNI